MKEKVKRILDLVRAGKLTLEDAAPLLAALNTKLALQSSDRELIDSLLKREDMDTGQIAEHLMLLRGVKEAPPSPPQPPRPPRISENWGGTWGNNWDEPQEPHDHNHRTDRRARRNRDGLVDRLTGGIDDMVERITETVERTVEGVDRSINGNPQYQYQYQSSKRPNSSTRILKIEVESEDGDEYSANIPTSLAPHLHKLIPTYGVRALEKSGFSLESLQLIIEADPPSGNIIQAEDENGNRVQISIK